MSDEVKERQVPDPDKIIGSEEASAVLRNDTLNLLKKVDSGKPMTLQERQRFENLLTQRIREENEKNIALAEGMAQGMKERLSKVERDHTRKMRMLKVFELKCAGYSVSKIALTLGMTRETVGRHIKAMDAEFSKLLSVKDATRLIRERMTELEMAKVMAMREAQESRGANRHCFMATYLNILSAQIKFMQDVGIIPKTPIALEHSGPDGGPIALKAESSGGPKLDDLTDEELAVLERAAQRITGTLN